MAKNILKEAIADAKAVREVALANAKAALEEAFTPRLQSMLSAKLSETLNEEEDELLLFRCMDNDEYLNFKNGGSTMSPSFSLIPDPISYLKCVSTLIDLEKTNVIVCCGFKFRHRWYRRMV